LEVVKMDDRNKNQGAAFWWGFFLGACTGAFVAWLLMPEEGTELRSRLRERGIELKKRAELTTEEASKRAEELRARLMELSAEARKLAESLQEQSRITLEEQRARLEEALAEGREAAKKKREELEAQTEGKEEAE